MSHWTYVKGHFKASIDSKNGDKRIRLGNVIDIKCIPSYISIAPREVAFFLYQQFKLVGLRLLPFQCIKGDEGYLMFTYLMPSWLGGTTTTVCRGNLRGLEEDEVYDTVQPWIDNVLDHHKFPIDANVKATTATHTHEWNITFSETTYTRTGVEDNGVGNGLDKNSLHF